MKVWLLYANAGGGHRQPASALAEELNRKYESGVETSLIDITGESRSLLKFILERGYGFVIDYVPLLYRFIYQFSKLGPVMKVDNYLVVAGRKEFFIKKLKENPPDKIVAFFYLFGPVIEALRELNLKIPVTVVVTDPYTTHPLWFIYKDLNYIVFSDQVRQTAIESGVPAKNVMVFPPVLHNKFKLVAGGGSPEDYRRRLGLPQNKKIVLLIGGGLGLPKGDEALHVLLESSLDAHYVIVCGKNERFCEKAKRIQKKYGPERVTIYGFVDFVEQLIVASDVVIGKAGASVTMETLLLGKPLIIISFIWGVEEGNVDFVVNNKLGWYEPKLEKLPGLIKEILQHPNSGGMDGQKKAATVASGTEAIAAQVYNF